MLLRRVLKDFIIHSGKDFWNEFVQLKTSFRNETSKGINEGQFTLHRRFRVHNRWNNEFFNNSIKMILNKKSLQRIEGTERD